MASVTERAPERSGESPRGPRRSWTEIAWRLAKNTLREAWDDRIFGLAAEAGFWQLLSLAPLALVILGVIGFFGGELGPDRIASIEQAIENAATQVLVPSAVHSLIHPVVHDVLRNGSTEVASIGFVIALWSSSSAMADYVNTIVIAYDLRDVRSAVRTRVLALLFSFGFIASAIVLLPVLVVGPDVIINLTPAGGARDAVSTIVHVFYYPFVAVVVLSLLATLYHLSVPARNKWRRTLPGAVVAGVIWIVGSLLLRLYFVGSFSGASIYSTVSAPIAILLFFYITAGAVLIGAELNAEIDKMWPTPATERAREISRRKRAKAGS
jgi:membrane protein